MPAGNLPPRVGVVRDAFAPHDQEPRSLASSVAPLGQGSAAVASALSQSDSRQVVDEYEFGRDGQYHIKLVATDLLRWAAQASSDYACFASCGSFAMSYGATHLLLAPLLAVG